MTKAIANNIYNYREKIFILLVLGIIVCALSYAYLLHGAIANVVQREKVVKENRTIGGRIGELEAKYFTLKNTIDMELAHAKGFKDGEISTFISKKSLTAMANHNEL
jgi:hypothetical protein